ncbi:MAG: ParB N-terminal domain-containing protein [Magnetococcus sp. DMHC-8]
MSEIVLVPINNIVIGKRHRQDLGDIEALAGSINTLGLLQPIGVDSRMNLVFGQRRLEACRSLGWESIPVRLIDAPAILAENDENEVRKEFTPSERVAIGKTIEELLGNRQGQRTDVDVAGLPQNFAEVKAGQETRAVAAQMAGFGNAETYRQAKAVVANGSPKLVEAMDRGEVSISAAATLSKLPQEQQQATLAGGKEAVLGCVRQTRDIREEPRRDHNDFNQVAQPPAKSGIQAMYAGQSGNNEWFTPSKWIELARQAMGSIDVDPASNATAQQTVQAARWYDQEQDGLQQEWSGNVWLNPPYARGLIDGFVDKLLEQFQSGTARQAIALVDNRTDTRWFHALCSVASAVAFTKGRVNFYNETVEASSPANGSVFVYLGPCVNAFKRAFDHDCLVLFTHEASSIQEVHHGS